MSTPKRPPRYLALMDRLNPLLVGLLHAPGLHRMASRGLLTITLDGRRSGRRLRFPVGYHDQRDAFVVLCSDASSRRWWRNFREPWPATLRVRGRDVAVRGEVLLPDSPEYRDRVSRSFRRAAFIPRMFDVAFDPAVGLTPRQADALHSYAAVVRFRPVDGTRPGP